MKFETLYSQSLNRLSESQRKQFFAEGYLVLEHIVPDDVVSKMCDALLPVIERSRHLTPPHPDFSFDRQHSNTCPRPSRLFRACDEDSAYLDYALHPQVLEVAADLVGPSVRYRETYINFKWPNGSLPVDWHQDFVFFPLTNRCMLTMVTYLQDVTLDMGPLMVLPASHKARLFDHFDDSDVFSGKVSERDLATLALDAAISIPGRAGTVIIFDGFMLHGSQPNQSDTVRPVLVMGYSAGDAFPYTDLPPPHKDAQAWQIVRGERPRYAHIEPISVRVPPVWTQSDFKPIFDIQKTT